MPYVRFARDFEHEQENGTMRRIPRGWAGNVSDEIAAEARKGGFLNEPAGQGGAARVADTGAGEPDEDMTRDQLDGMARAAGIDPAEHRTKADLVAAIRDARA